MTRLTKYLREKMALKLLQHRFQYEGNALSARSVELFNLVYADRYDQPTRDLMARLIKRHKAAFEHTTKLRINVRGMALYIGEDRIGDGAVRFAAAPDPVPVFRSTSSLEYLDCKIAVQLEAFATDTRRFSDGIKTARSEVMATLGNFTTEKQLAEQWPEIIPLVGHLFSETLPSTNLPAVRIAQLNAAFGLPPADSAEHTPTPEPATAN